MSSKKRNDGRREQYRMAKLLDEKSQFEEFKEEILPKVRAMLREGKTSEEIRRFAQSYVTARQVTIALTSENEAAVLKAADALTFQNEGKPKERTEHTHKFGKLPDNELDAVLTSKLRELEDKKTNEH